MANADARKRMKSIAPSYLENSKQPVLDAQNVCGMSLDVIMGRVCESLFLGRFVLCLFHVVNSRSGARVENFQIYGYAKLPWPRPGEQMEIIPEHVVGTKTENEKVRGQPSQSRKTLWKNRRQGHQDLEHESMTGRISQRKRRQLAENPARCEMAMTGSVRLKWRQVRPGCESRPTADSGNRQTKRSHRSGNASR